MIESKNEVEKRLDQPGSEQRMQEEETTEREHSIFKQVDRPVGNLTLHCQVSDRHSESWMKTAKLGYKISSARRRPPSW